MTGERSGIEKLDVVLFPAIGQRQDPVRGFGRLAVAVRKTDQQVQARKPLADTGLFEKELSAGETIAVTLSSLRRAPPVAFKVYFAII